MLRATEDVSEEPGLGCHAMTFSAVPITAVPLIFRAVVLFATPRAAILT